MATSCTCASSSCRHYVCPKPCSTLSRVQRRVRMPMTLYTSRQSAFSINVKGPDLFSGPSDRYQTNGTPWGGKKGVAKKHNSYARYLGRLKGPVLRRDMRYGDAVGGCSEAQCCCFCEQTLFNQDTGLPTLFVGDTVSQSGTNATGTIIKIELLPTPPHDVERVTIRVDDCSSLFDDSAITIDRLGYPWSNFTIIETTTCPPPKTTRGR